MYLETSQTQVTSGMKIVVIVALCLLFFGIQVDCKVERYAWHIVENGTIINEEVEVNVEDQTEVIRVPQHNDVDAVEVLNDFAAGLSVRRVPSTQDCYVSKLESSLASPQTLKLNLDKESKNPLPDKVTVKKTTTRVLGFANRLALPQTILDFCGSFPIYNVEVVLVDSMPEASFHKTQGHRRRKRNHIHTNFNSCSDAGARNMFRCIRKHNGFKFPIKCKYDTHTCYYTYICKHDSTVSKRTQQWRCDIKAHYLDMLDFCCEPKNKC